MRSRLVAANVRQQDAPLAEVESLLKTLAEGWRGILPANRTRADASEPCPERSGVTRFPPICPEGTPLIPGVPKSEKVLTTAEE